MEEFKSVLAEEFASYGSLSDDQLSLLSCHYDLLLRWNKTLNLTRITGLRDAVRYHYCESLYLARSLPQQPLRIVDVGSGGGFPGIPVAVYLPECSVVLVEAHKRKAVFLAEALRQLSLANATVLPQRAEDIRPAGDLSNSYDWLISRAVNPTEVLRLNLAPEIALLGTSGEKLPWGEGRALFHVKH